MAQRMASKVNKENAPLQKRQRVSLLHNNKPTGFNTPSEVITTTENGFILLPLVAGLLTSSSIV